MMWHSYDAFEPFKYLKNKKGLSTTVIAGFMTTIFFVVVCSSENKREWGANLNVGWSNGMKLSYRNVFVIEFEKTNKFYFRC